MKSNPFLIAIANIFQASTGFKLIVALVYKIKSYMNCTSGEE